MASAARFLLYCLIVWAPLPLGSNRPIFWLINGVVTLVILILFLAGEFTSGEHWRRLDWRPAAWALGALSIWVVWMVVQAWPGTPGSLHHPQWASLGGDTSHAFGAISINPGATWTTIVQVVPPILLSVVAMRLAVDPQRSRFILNVIIAATVVVAVYGLVTLYGGIKQTFLVDTVAYQGFLTGTFVGRNAAATYFAIGLAATAAMIVAPAKEPAAGETEGDWRLHETAVVLARRHWYLAAFLVLAVAIFNTGSRAGVVAGVTALLSVAVLSLRQKQRVGRAFRITVALLLASLLMVFAMFSGVMVDRFESSLSNDVRWELYQDTLDMIAARPLLGHGAGTFADVFPLYHERVSSSLVWNAAHNTYLQMSAELGLPVSAIVMFCFSGVLIYLIVRLRRQAVPVAVAAVSAAFATALHSLFDFSVQFQAVGLTLAVLVGAGVGEVSVAATRRSAGKGTRPTSNAPSASYKDVRVEVPTLSKGAAPSSSPNPSVPDGMRVYVFGDVHGRYDLLIRLREAISRDREKESVGEAMVIGLGDYIDRGPESRDVVEALASDFFKCRTVLLRGNHEQMLIDFLEDPLRMGPRWFHLGAAATLHSYIAADATPSTVSRIHYDQVRAKLASEIPPAHLLFLQRLATSFEIGDYFFAHAGARPGVPLGMQDPRDLLWIRDGISDADPPFAKVVVHGHSPVDEPYFGSHRINIDTGAYFTNRLTCLVLEGAKRRVLEV